MLVTTVLAKNVLASDDAPATVPAMRTGWILRQPTDKTVEFHGLGNFDDGGLGNGGMLYPAPNAVGLLAAIVTHALIVDSVKRNQMNEIQEQADKVLTPYRPVIDQLDLRELMTKSLAAGPLGGTGQLSDSETLQPGQTLVESAPRFSMTKDQSAILVDNILAIQKPGSSAESAYRNTVRVVVPGGNSDHVAYWMANNGEKLIEACIKGLADSFAIAFRDADGALRDEPPYRTVRYREGNVERMERAQIIEQRCGRMILKTLRGSLMSVPGTPSTITNDTGTCNVPVAISAN